jgi:hypothetical protein
VTFAEASLPPPPHERISRPDAGLMSADAYRRHARRLRDRHAGRPGELHRALCDLGQERDRHRARDVAHGASCIDTEPGRAQTVKARRRTYREPPIGPVRVAEDPARQFAAEVQSKLAAGLLHYSDRLALLRTARRLGLSRFDANLLIAAAQHERPSPKAAPLPPPSRQMPRALVALIAFLLIEMAIGITAWSMLGG